MRIAIDFRILAVGPQAINRGMPRYTQQQLRHVLALDHDNDYLVLTHEGEDLSLIDPAIRTAHNVSVTHPPGWSVAEPGYPTTMLRRSAEFQDWLLAQDVALFHATTPFLFIDPFVLDFDVCPMVGTFYDAIPMIYPQHYLREPFRDVYRCCIALIRRCTRLLAISDSARRDASVYMGFPRDRIDIASPIADACFRPLGPDARWRALAALGERVRIPEQFVLTVTSVHHSKNAETLLEAYAALDEPLRVRFPLVFCCHLDEAGQRLVRSLADRLGIADDVIVTGMVTDTELAALYNAATVVVHPSRYEGFGLPVLEAMRCGTPVITTTASSLPEAGGDAAVLVDPEDCPGMAAAMTAVLRDSERREEMARAGLVQAARFTGEALGRATLAGYARTLAPPVEPHHETQPQPPRRRLAVWAPLPPEQTGIADYTVDLLSGLSRHVDVEVFVNEGFLPDIDLMSRYRVHDHRAFERRRTQAGFDAVIYQLGGSFFHWYMNEALQRYPGIAVLHDLSWSHLLYAHSELHHETEAFRSELVEMEGELALRCFDAIQEEGGPPSLREEFLDVYPMLGRIAAASPALVVPFEAARRELEARYPQARVRTVVMGVADPYTGPRWREWAVARRHLGLPESAYVIGAFGIVHQSKRLEAVIEALLPVQAQAPHAVLLVVGRAHDPRYLEKLEGLVRRRGLEGSVRFLGEVDRRTFDGALVGCDVVVNLRESTVTHMSATLMRAMAAAKPIVTSEVPGWDFLPAAACLRVPAGGSDADVVTALSAHLCRLACDPVLRRSMGEAARRYFEQEATAEIMARRYLEIVDDVRAEAERVNFNKVCELEDFADPELVEVMRDVCAQKTAHFPDSYPAGYEARKDWEVAMSVRALRHFGALGPDAVILGVAAGMEDTVFYLTRHARQVFVTDRYLGAGAWGTIAPVAMLVDPGFLAPFDFDANRLVVQHMDGRSLRYPDETFDAVFSSGSIEHFGELLDVAHAAYEMGRVLKPGGLVVLSTEFRITGPPGGIGWPGDALLLSAENLQRYVVEASGLEPVDELQTDLSDITRATVRYISQAKLDHDRRLAGAGGRGVPEYAAWDFPHVVMSHGGYEFGSVHLTLRRPPVWPATDNEWARPPQETLDSIAAWNAGVLADGDRGAGDRTSGAHDNAQPQAAGTGPVGGPGAGRDRSSDSSLPPLPPSAAEGTWDERKTAVAALVDVATTYRRTAGAHLSGVLSLLDRTRGELGTIERDTADAEHLIPSTSRVRVEAARRSPQNPVDASRLEPAPAPADRTGWKQCRADLGGDRAVAVVVDTSSADPITGAIARAETPLFRPLVDLMLLLTQPGELVVDLGAHIGTFALAAAGAGRRVVAFEASAANSALLRASVAANRFWNLQVVTAAVGDTAGTVESWSRGPWGHVATAGDDVVSETVPAVTVDATLHELGVGRPRFVKIDVEGCEVATIRGMRPLLEPDDAPTLLYEANGHTLDLFGETPESLTAALDALGYTSYYVDYVVDPPLLIRVQPGVMQPETLVDCLAVKHRPDSIPGWRFAPPMTVDERVQRMVADCLVPNPDHRAYLARRLRDESRDILEHPALAPTLAALAVDPADAVWEAAAWLRAAHG